MNLLAIVAALALEQWHSFQWRAAVERTFLLYVRGIERRLNGGTLGQGIVATVLAIAPPVAFAVLAWWALARVHPALGLLFNVLVLYALMGFRRFSHAISAIIAALKVGDLGAARRALAAWRGETISDLSSQDIARLAIERGLSDAYRQVFAVLFWFVVLPGPAGAVLYRSAALLAGEWKGALPGDDMTVLTRSLQVFGRPARLLLWLLDWVPARLTALSFAVVGDFEDAAYCWRTQARSWPEAYGGESLGVVLASGGGALGVQLGGSLPGFDGAPDPRPEIGMGEAVEAEVLPSAVGL
ncbi:MAG TPA: regulatory signaling modulator protein AmpE, partial [Casimicrobiaceae bacterium]|nr:regulatory signaling modulator protein AmpE [Casimicrobiaceae bacterium]